MADASATTMPTFSAASPNAPPTFSAKTATGCSYRGRRTGWRIDGATRHRIARIEEARRLPVL